MYLTPEDLPGDSDCHWVTSRCLAETPCLIYRFPRTCSDFFENVGRGNFPLCPSVIGWQWEISVESIGDFKMEEFTRKGLFMSTSSPARIGSSENQNGLLRDPSYSYRRSQSFSPLPVDLMNKRLQKDRVKSVTHRDAAHKRPNPMGSFTVSSWSQERPRI